LRGGGGGRLLAPTHTISTLIVLALKHPKTMSSVLALTSKNAKAAAALELPELTSHTRFILSVADLCELGCFVKSERTTKEDGSFTRTPTGERYVDLRIPLERFLACIQEVPEAAKVPEAETIVSRRGGKEGSPKASPVEVPPATPLTEAELGELLEKLTPHPRRAKFDDLLFREYGRGPADYVVCYKQYVAHAAEHHPMALKKAEKAASGSEGDASPVSASTAEKRPRGRPKGSKNKTKESPVETPVEAPKEVPKEVPAVPAAAASVSAPAPAEKKARGRPKKSVSPPAPAPAPAPAPVLASTPANLASLLDEVEDE
jgi:hypothetical protein